MAKDSDWEKLGNDLKTFTIWFLASLMDSAFLAGWALLQTTVNKYIVLYIQLDGIDKLIFVVFQVIFAISTLIPIIAYITTDMWRIIQQTRKKLRRLM